MFVVTKLLGLLAHPSVDAIALLTVGIVLRRRAVAWAGLIVLLAIVLLPLDDWASRPLENRFAPPDPARVDGVVVLGGAVDELVSTDRGTPALTWGGARVLAMGDLARRWPDAAIVFAGGSGRIGPQPVTEADAVRDLLPALGLAPGRVRFDRRSRTTAENATEALRLAEPRPGQCWLLVTSALHMPRAMAEFRAVGFPVASWPVGYTTRRDTDLWLEPPAARLGRLDGAAHEWVGLLALALRPAPAAPPPLCDERSPQ